MAEKKNPANGKVEFPKGFRPMTTATLRLEVPQKDGWHRHWFRGTPERIARARQAGYMFVEKDELEEEGVVNSFDLAGDSDAMGSTDLGTRVSVISGDDIDAKSGQPGRMYLMQCPEEYYEEAQRIVDSRNDDIATALRGGMAGSEQESGVDKNNRYVDFQRPGSKLKAKVPDLFIPKKRST